MSFDAQRQKLAEIYQAETVDDTVVLAQLQLMFQQAAQEGVRERFDAVVAEMSDVDVAFYEAYEPRLLSWRAVNAVIDGRSEALSYATLKLAGAADRDIAAFTRTANMLAYHNEIEVLATMLTTAWPLISQSDEVAQTQKQALASLTTDTLIFQYLSQPETADFDGLMETLNRYFPVDAEGLQRYMKVLAHEAGYRWQLRDFEFESNEQAAQNLAALMIEAVAHLHHENGVPYPKANLLRLPLLRYFTERRTGQLKPRTDMAAVLRGERPMPRMPEDRHPLCPDADTLSRFFEKTMHASRPRPYETAVLFQLLPGWLGFLRARGLIDAEWQQQTMGDVANLQSELLQLWQNYPQDPSLAANTERWHGEA